MLNASGFGGLTVGPKAPWWMTRDDNSKLLIPAQLHMLRSVAAMGVVAQSPEDDPAGTERVN
jgi:hypothetical protein